MNIIQHKFVEGIEHKLCTRCGIWRTLDSFHKYWDRADGLDGKCKLCKNMFSLYKYATIRNKCE